MKKIALAVLYCIISCSAFGSDSQLADKSRFFRDMQDAACIIIDKNIGGARVQNLWEEMKRTCERGEKACERGDGEDAQKMCMLTMRLHGAINEELKSNVELGRGEKGIDGMRCILDNTFITQCRYAATVVTLCGGGGGEEFLDRVVRCYERGVEAWKQGQEDEVMSVIEELAGM